MTNDLADMIERSGMKVSLDGLIANAGDALKCSRDSYGKMYAYVLEELRDHIKGLVNGKHTIEEFAEHYCIKRDVPPKTAQDPAP